MKITYSNGLYDKIKWSEAKMYGLGVNSEDTLQQAIINAWRSTTPRKEWFRVFHVANGGKRNALEALKFKRMGVVSGISDLVCLLPHGKVGFIELKYGKNGMSDNQKEFRSFCVENNYPYALCRSIGEALDTLKDWRIYEPKIIRGAK